MWGEVGRRWEKVFPHVTLGSDTGSSRRAARTIRALLVAEGRRRVQRSLSGMALPIRALLCSLLALAALACEASGDKVERKSAGAAGGGSGGSGVGPDGTLPDGTPASALLPARIRRLTNAEYDASVQALTNTALEPAQSFAPDSRQDGFTLNEAQRVDPLLAKQLASAAEAIAAELKAN